MRDITGELRQALASGALALPLPAAGRTAARHDALFQFGRRDLSFARLAEAHTDAVSILAEAGRLAIVDSLYGVWASEGPTSALTLSLDTGQLTLIGSKRYCSGASLLDRALVTARSEGASVLVDIPLASAGISFEADWGSPAFADVGTATVHFNNVKVPREAILGAPHWYLKRSGFWHGAIGPAACWAGGAAGLVDAARALGRTDPHSRAHLGALEANLWGLSALLNEAGRQIDEDPNGARSDGRLRALKVRHLIERLCTDIIDRFGRATGPQLLAFDASIAQRHAELSLYIRQCHGERDLETIPLTR